MAENSAGGAGGTGSAAPQNAEQESAVIGRVDREARETSSESGAKQESGAKPGAGPSARESGHAAAQPGQGQGGWKPGGGLPGAGLPATALSRGMTPADMTPGGMATRAGTELAKKAAASAASDLEITSSERDDSAVLGAGGTSEAVEQDKGGATPGGGLKDAGKVAATAAAAPAAAALGKLLMIMSFINWLKGMVMNILALAANLWNLILGTLLAWGQGVVGAVMGVGATISAAVGGAVSAAVAGSVAFVGGGVVVAVAVAGTISAIATGQDIAWRDAPLTDCTVVAKAALDDLDGSSGAEDEQTRANAERIYSVLRAWKMPEENIAGIIGNWDAESGIDPTSVQGYFSTPHVLTDDERDAATNTDNGIGLGQWTFGRNANLRSYADGHDADWWTIDMQLGFMLSPAEGSDADVVRDMIANPIGSPADAALHFHDKWERSADTPAMAERRAEYAASWMGMFGGWKVDEALADSILAQSGGTVGDANDSRAEEVRSECRLVKDAPEHLADGNAPGAWGGHDNGKIPESELSEIPWPGMGGKTYFLRSDAAEAFLALNEEFKDHFGWDIPVNDAYRDYANQEYWRGVWCGLGSCQNAAVPGTSNHGWALAIDIGTQGHATISFGSPEYLWLKENAPGFGWVHPAYMEPGGSGPFEAWHWEFYGLKKG